MKASGQASDGEQLHPSFSYLNKTTRRNHAFDQTPHKEYLISNQHFAKLFEKVVLGFQFNFVLGQRKVPRLLLERWRGLSQH